MWHFFTSWMLKLLLCMNYFLHHVVVEDGRPVYPTLRMTLTAHKTEKLQVLGLATVDILQNDSSTV
jgi:hypothetical protein